MMWLGAARRRWRAWRRVRRSSSRVLWAVRRDWPVDGVHEFVRARSTPSAALREMARDRAYWRRGPVRPELSVVRISAHEFALHHRARWMCRAPACPSARVPDHPASR